MLKGRNAFLLASGLLCSLWLAPIASASDSNKNPLSFMSSNSELWQQLDAGLRVNLDSSRFDGIYTENTSNEITTNGYNYDSELRRGRVFLKLPLGENWSSKLQIAINESDKTFETKDLFILYRGLDIADIKLGQSKEPFGLENITSSANLPFIERSLSPFSLGRSKGINLFDSKRKYSWSMGVYSVEQNSKIKSDGDKAYTARFTYSPVNKGKKYNHLGLAYSKRNLEGAEYEIKSNGNVNTASNFLDTKNIATDTIEKSGLEAAWGRGALSLQGEYQHLQINAIDIAQNASYQSFYTQLSYFLTNDHRPYKKGRFSGVKPSSASGAWELILRNVSLQSVHIGDSNKNTPIDITTRVVGINYYLNRQVKLMLNASDTDSVGIVDEGLANTGSALTLRAQLRL